VGYKPSVTAIRHHYFFIVHDFMISVIAVIAVIIDLLLVAESSSANLRLKFSSTAPIGLRLLRRRIMFCPSRSKQTIQDKRRSEA